MVKRVVYTVMLAVVYVAATLLSSLAVLTCDHPHHTHANAEATHCGCCAGQEHHHDVGTLLALDDECCDHEHELLGENHTEFIVEKQRGDDAMPLLYALDLSVALVAECASFNHILTPHIEPYRGSESLPLWAAFSRCDSLRAPPSIA